MRSDYFSKVKSQTARMLKQYLCSGFRKENKCLFFILLLALVVRLHLAFTCDVVPDFSDMSWYNRMAVEGTFKTFYRVPLYPLFLRTIYSIFGNYNYKAVFVTQGIIGTIMILFMYKLSVRICGRTAGLICAIICSIYPNFIMYNLTTLTETLSLFLVVLIMYTASTRIADAYRTSLSAVLVGLGILIKPALVFFMPGMFVALRKRWILILIIVCILTPWTIRNAIVYKRLIPISDTGVVMFYDAYNPDPDSPRPVMSPSAYAISGFKFIWNNKLNAMENIYNKTAVLISKDWDSFVMGGRAVESKRNLSYTMKYSYLPVMILGFIGFARYYRKEHREVVLPVLGYVVIHILFSFFKFRFRVLIEPMLIMYASILLSGKGKPIQFSPMEGKNRL